MISVEPEPSKLGTKEHWDFVYSRENTNFDEDSDVGEIWFGENVLNKVIEKLVVCSRCNPETPFVDIGCGNGYTLIKLWEKGFTNLVGTDYSESAIQLARKIAEKSNAKIEFYTDDLMNTCCAGKNFGVVFDKGTFDAISLSTDSEWKAKYKKSIVSMLSKSGLFVITSCNYVRSELESFFCPEFCVFDEVKHKSFSFGGQKGNNYTTLLFIPKCQ